MRPVTPRPTPVFRRGRYPAWAALAVLVAACGAEGAGRAQSSPPPPPPESWAEVIGEYALGRDTLSVLEDGGELYFLPWHRARQALTPVGEGSFRVEGGEGTLARLPGTELRLTDSGGMERIFPRIYLGGEGGSTFQITPVGDPEELRREALAATPPNEEGDFLPSDLVDLTTLDSTIKLDIRYATTNNFLGEVFYSSPRAFLQRPAAAAVARTAAAWRSGATASWSTTGTGPGM